MQRPSSAACRRASEFELFLHHAERQADLRLVQLDHEIAVRAPDRLRVRRRDGIDVGVIAFAEPGDGPARNVAGAGEFLERLNDGGLVMAARNEREKSDPQAGGHGGVAGQPPEGCAQQAPLHHHPPDQADRDDGADRVDGEDGARALHARQGVGSRAAERGCQGREGQHRDGAALAFVFGPVKDETHHVFAEEQDEQAERPQCRSEQQQIAHRSAPQAAAAAFLPGQDRALRQNIVEPEEQRVAEGDDAHARGIDAGDRGAGDDHREPIRDVALDLHHDLIDDEPAAEIPALPHGRAERAKPQREIGAREIQPSGGGEAAGCAERAAGRDRRHLAAPAEPGQHGELADRHRRVQNQRLRHLQMRESEAPEKIPQQRERHDRGERPGDAGQFGAGAVGEQAQGGDRQHQRGERRQQAAQRERTAGMLGRRADRAVALDRVGQRDELALDRVGRCQHRDCDRVGAELAGIGVTADDDRRQETRGADHGLIGERHKMHAENARQNVAPRSRATGKVCAGAGCYGRRDRKGADFQIALRGYSWSALRPVLRPVLGSVLGSVRTQIDT